MTGSEAGTSGGRRHRVRVALQFGLGVGLLVLGVGNLTDTIAWTLPPLVYLGGGVALLAYALVLVRRN
ncbi:hypothetical protein [Haloarchaeobius iranensis]|uniref:Uncharacterized protein n=1 Tax=Haloarchaeobius iranensis TaxID=996166 RepID=A0A1G9YIB3_9EURY|nr:hypothetical protein [Haloarchaeobius iranensis]SDN08235.1 hypothetical protein SAMN05192554_11463 [Haloarchaeobius iranensis]